MTEQEFDNLIREALLLAAEKRLAETPDWQGELSPKYRRRFKRMLANPKQYAKRWQEKPWQKLRRYASAAAVLLAIGGSAFLCVPQLQIIASNLFSEKHEGYNSYNFIYRTTKEDLILSEIDIGYIPESYKLCDEHNYFNKTKSWDYINENGDYLFIHSYVNESGFENYIDNEHHTQEYIMLTNGQQAILLKGENEYYGNILLWTNEQGNIALMVSGKIPPEELMKIAINITLK